MNLTDWATLSQVIYNFAAVIAAFSALIVYGRNSRLERARWAASLYEKFYERDQLKRVRDKLDCETDAEQVNELVFKAEADFTDYLNFFEFVAYLEYTKQLKPAEIEDLFGYYLDCLQRQGVIRRYIKESGYERLNNLLEGRR